MRIKKFLIAQYLYIFFTTPVELRASIGAISHHAVRLYTLSPAHIRSVLRDFFGELLRESIIHERRAESFSKFACPYTTHTHPHTCTLLSKCIARGRASCVEFDRSRLTRARYVQGNAGFSHRLSPSDDDGGEAEISVLAPAEYFISLRMRPIQVLSQISK